MASVRKNRGGLLRSYLAVAIAIPGTLVAADVTHSALAGPAHASKNAASVSIAPKSGKEGTTVTITYPKALPEYPKPRHAIFYDPGVHGYYIARGAGVYVAYDARSRLKYTVPAAAVIGAAKKNKYTATIPPGICGIIIKSTQATLTHVPAGAVQGSPTVIGQSMTKYPLKSSPGKTLQVWLVGEKGKPAKFSLTCDKYTFSVKVKADPKRVLVPGSSDVTATLTVKGPAQVVVGAKIKKPAKPLNLLAPLAFEEVMFDTNFGTLAPPAPAKVTTGTDGTAAVSVSSGDPGTATVRAVALGLGDGRATVKFYKLEPPDRQQETTGNAPAQSAENNPTLTAFNIGGIDFPAATFAVDYANFSPSAGANENQYGTAIGVLTNPFSGDTGGTNPLILNDNMTPVDVVPAQGGGIEAPLLEFDASYHHSSTTGSSSNNWTAGTALIWNQLGWRFGPVFGFQSSSTGSFSAQTYNYGAFAEWFAAPNVTVFAKGGGFSGDFSNDGYYLGGLAKYYGSPDFALNGGIDYTHYTSFGGFDETDYSIGGEYLFSETTPISFFGGYTYSDYSYSYHVSQVFVGLRFYLNGAGVSTLLDRQRTGLLGPHQFKF